MVRVLRVMVKRQGEKCLLWTSDCEVVFSEPVKVLQKNLETAVFWPGVGGGCRLGVPTAAASPSFPETCAPQLHSTALHHFSGGCGDETLRSRTVGARPATVQPASVTEAKQQAAPDSVVTASTVRGEGWRPSQ